MAQTSKSYIIDFRVSFLIKLELTLILSSFTHPHANENLYDFLRGTQKMIFRIILLVVISEPLQ